MTRRLPYRRLKMHGHGVRRGQLDAVELGVEAQRRAAPGIRPQVLFDSEFHVLAREVRSGPGENTLWVTV